MSPDRYGDDEPPHQCRNGWLTGPNDDHPRLCPICRPPRRPDIHDDANRPVSDRARAAIEREDRNA